MYYQEFKRGMVMCDQIRVTEDVLGTFLQEHCWNEWRRHCMF